MDNWWKGLPKDVQVLLNLVQVYIDSKDTLTFTLTTDLVNARKVHSIDINAVVDKVVINEMDLTGAVRDYRRAGGNHREVPNA